jgi:hypothetical protein
MNTLSSNQVTRVISASVVVVTVKRRKVACSCEANSGSALVWSLAFWSSDASNSCDVIADITRGRNTRWADQLYNNTVTSIVVALEGFSNWGFDVAGLWSSDATSLRITVAGAATICGWWTDNAGLNDSFERITYFVDALVLEIVGDVNRSVDTFSGLDVAGVCSAQVVVVTVDRSVDTSSGISVAWVHRARIQIITQFWQVLTESSGRYTYVNGTCITIIARFLRESDTSSHCLIAFGRSAFVDLVAV